MKLASILVACALLFCATSLIAQEDDEGSSAAESSSGRSDHIDMPAETVVDRATEAPRDTPSPDHGDRSLAGGTSANRVDPFPALTAANNAYDQALAAWQQAYNNYQQALAEQKAIRDKYVDENNTVRAGFDYYTALTVVNAADKKAEDAWYELDRAEKARNEASSRAGAEFQRAMEQYYGGGGAAGGAGASPSPGPSTQGPKSGTADRACGHC
jgi:hypothetical protein